MARTRPSSRPVELWGGIECTHARIGRRCFDQLERSGHLDRVADLDLIAHLGVTALRYPVLWERVVPDGDLAKADWSWTDERLERLRELGVRPIVGLLHHGNGPPTTDLLDPGFAERFAAYARAVAERYPWVDAYVPINEPLTTARFCGLYGFWHPHRTDPASFARILHHQLRGSVLAIRAIREVAPEATFIQNEDIGKVHATPTLAYEAERQNDRRWLTFDLLTGRVDAEHPMWTVLSSALSRDELERYRDDPFPPDVIGFDHYVTSERFLDEAMTPYPERYHGGNGRHEYADVEAVWSLSDGPAGVESLLEDAWQRYRMPLALTEVHLGGTREEQMRWLVESYEAALAVRSRGGDVRAVTVWALLGMYDWNSLLLDPSGFYESGAFDVRDEPPRPTALAETIRALATGRSYAHPVLSVPGWWHRPERLIYRRTATVDEPPVQGFATVRPERADIHAVGSSRSHAGGSAPRLAFLTDGGDLARAFETAMATRGLPFAKIDATTGDVGAEIDAVRPWGVVDVAGLSPSLGERSEETVAGTSSAGSADTAVVAAHAAAAEAAERAGIAFLLASSWTVFRGGDAPRFEDEPPDATSDIGKAWRRIEAAVLDAAPAALVVRPGPLLGSPLAPLDALARPNAAGQMIVSPSYAPDVASVALDLLIDGERGVRHLPNAGLVAVAAGPVLRRSCVLGARAILLPMLADAIARAHETPVAPREPVDVAHEIGA